ncbi:MAG: molybdopterin-dependent oxidoreductase [Nitrospiraceae bacterium]|nr:MAG: molybdopterin-dependent oxidoreductase [Nitrospiraceae bacterium]
MIISRRDFLRYASVTATGTAAGLADAEFLSELLAMGMTPPFNIFQVPTYCEMCFWNCGAIATVVNDRVVKLEGNPVCPRSRGKLCARGNGGIGQLYDPDRLKHPLIRSGSRGDGKYRKVSWDEALGYVADKMTAIKDRYGAESLAFMMHGSITSHLMTLRGAFGSPNFAFPSFAQCRGARVVAYELTYGSDVGSPERVDMRNSKAIVLFGTHLGENMHNSQTQDFAEAVGNRAKIIVVDPRFSTAAGKARHWLPIKPGTDTALVLTWINIIINEDLYDHDYVDAYTLGFDELKETVKDYTPEWASEETDLPASLIVKTARELASNMPSVCIHPGRFTAWHGNDTQRERAIAILGAILGTWGRKGGIYLPTTSWLPMPEAKVFPKPARTSLTGGPHRFSKPQLMHEVRRATIEEMPYPIKGWIVAGTNVLKSVPAPARTLEAMKKLDLFVAIDILPTDSVMMADVILPECTYLERHDNLKVHKGRSLTVNIRQPVVTPLHESKEGWWIAKELASRLGLNDYFPYDQYEDYIRKQCEVMGSNYENLKKNGIIFYRNTAKPYITAANQPKFNTPTGKIELFSKRLEQAGFDPVPAYKPIRQPEKGWFRLLFGRSPVHTFSRTVNNQPLFELYKENMLWINADIASEMGIRDRQYIILVNQDGVRSNKIRARVTERIRKDCVFMVHGFGSRSKKLANAFMKGADDQRLISRFALDPISGSTGMRVNFVKMEKDTADA